MLEIPESYNLAKQLNNTIVAEQGGRDTEKDLFGNPGGYKTYLSKNTAFTPCVKCGYELHKGNYMGGTIYYCEHCQK
jgi:formamidopyrimidine-DNA glycosylase